MLVYEYKLDGNTQQYAAIDEAIRIVQFIRNKCLRKWMDGRGVSKYDLQCYCAVLAQEYSFAARLNSQARQASAERAWDAISRFYKNCKEKKPGKKGYPRFQHDNRSVEYKTTGWRIGPDGKHITFTDGCGIGCLRLVGNKKQSVETFPVKQIKRVRIVKRADAPTTGFCRYRGAHGNLLRRGKRFRTARLYPSVKVICLPPGPIRHPVVLYSTERLSC